MSNLRLIELDSSLLSAFGTLESDKLTPVMQGDFVYGLNTQIWQTAVTDGAGATVDTHEGRLRIQGGTAAAGYAYQLSRKPIKYRAGQGIKLRATPIFTTGLADSVQLFGAGAVVTNAPYDGYFFGYNGVAFGIAHDVRGVAAWTAQTSWNVNTLTAGSFILDPTKGTPMMIVYPYLGYGNIMYYVQNPNTSRWVLVHVIKYANTTASTQLSNPSLYLMGGVWNAGNTTNLTIYCGSVGAFISGERSYVGNPRGTAYNNKSAITTETNIVSLRNATTYNGLANRGLIRLASFSPSSSSNAGVSVFVFLIGATLGGTPAFAPYDGTTADNGVTITSGNSIVSVDTAGTTIADGRRIYSVTVENPGGQHIDLLNEDIFIAPGETLTISAASTNSSLMGCSINWSEDI